MGRRKKAVLVEEKRVITALTDGRLLMTKALWLEKLDRMCMADPRKMFDPQGGVLDIHEIPDAEADLIEGIEVVENFAKVGDKAEHVGYVKKIKLTSRRVILKDYGEARGWLEPERQGPKTVLVRTWEAKEEYHDIGTREYTVLGNDLTRGDDDGAIQPTDAGNGRVGETVTDIQTASATASDGEPGVSRPAFSESAESLQPSAVSVERSAIVRRDILPDDDTP